ncbi:MAG TPA: hypothetical protein VM869_11360 [Enhygromyxa sp.]|nr:hypothetical protein [Enhygromyxa sp.]
MKKKQLTLSDLKNVKGSLDEAGKKSSDESYNKKHKATVECDCDTPR